MIETLKKLTEQIAPSGQEEAVKSYIKRELEELGQCYEDGFGNLILHLPGPGKKLLLAAHMDEIGVMITYIEEEGFLRFTGVGGIMAHTALHQKVKFVNGVIGVVGFSEKADAKDAKISQMYIDIGASSREEAEKMVQIGMTGGFMGSFDEQGGCISTRVLDDRAGCAVLMEVAKLAEGAPNDLYFAFTVQEEVGTRGAKTVGYDIMPDMAIAVDVTECGDTPDGEKIAVRLGKGPAIKVRDNSIISHPKVKAAMIQAARELNMPYQLEVLPFGGNDAGAIMLTGGGVPSGTLSIPIRYCHSPAETASVSDLKDCVRLLEKVVKTEV